MSKLLVEWKSNNEIMKTISPALLQSVAVVDNATKDQIEKTEKINVDHEKCSDEFNKVLIAISSGTKQHTEENQNQISSIIQSVVNRTKLSAASLKTSKNNIRQNFDQQKKMTLETFNNIKMKIVDGMQNVQSCSMDITNEFQNENTHFQEDYRKNVDFNTNVSTFVQQFHENSKKKLQDWVAVLGGFRKNEIKIYASSGEYGCL